MNDQKNRVDTSLVDSYIEKCFKDAFKSEERDYDEKAWFLRYIIIDHEESGKKIFLPIWFWCRYNRIFRKVVFRLGKVDNYFRSTLNLYYEKTDEYSFLVYHHPENVSLDPNHYIAFAECDRKNGKRTGSFITAVNRDYYSNVDFTKPIPAKVLYQLVLKYHNLTAEQLEKIHQENGEDPLLRLPNDVLEFPETFEKLYKETFGHYPSKGFDIIPGPGVKILSN